METALQASNGYSYLSTDSFNLIYPSALDADKFYRKIESARGTIYFWTHSTAITLKLDLLQEPQVQILILRMIVFV
jgi:hypothetical protein